MERDTIITHYNHHDNNKKKHKNSRLRMLTFEHAYTCKARERQKDTRTERHMHEYRIVSTEICRVELAKNLDLYRIFAIVSL